MGAALHCLGRLAWLAAAWQLCGAQGTSNPQQFDRRFLNRTFSCLCPAASRTHRTAHRPLCACCAPASSCGMGRPGYSSLAVFMLAAFGGSVGAQTQSRVDLLPPPPGPSRLGASDAAPATSSHGWGCGRHGVGLLAAAPPRPLPGLSARAPCCGGASLAVRELPRIESPRPRFVVAA